MSSKIYLKAAREAIGKGDWEEAKRQARLAIDSGGGDIAYNGHVFLGLALEKSRGGADWLEAQNSYFAAIQLNEENPLAIQGLCSLYEKIPEKMSEYISTSQKLASLFCKSDPKKALDILTKMLATVEQQASLNNSKIIQALYCFLDDTHIYPVLKDMNEFPPLTQTISRIINLQESLDLDYINREVNDRKTRLGADTAANIRIAMEKEVLLHSRLDVFYDRLISLSNAGGPSSSSSTTSDLKLKLLDLRNKRLIYSSNENDKRHFLGIVLNLASELVNLNCNISSALPYEILIDYSDVTIESIDKNLLIKASETLSDGESLKILASAHLKWRNNEDPGLVVDMILGVLERTQSCLVFGFQLLAAVYLDNKDFESCCSCVSKAREALKAVSAKTGTQSDLVKEYLDLVYGDSKRELELQTVLPESRRTFAESLAIYKTILSGNPSHVKALKGLACVLQAMKKYEEAIRFFEKILKLCPDDQESKAEMAWCHHCKGDSATGLKCLEELLLLSSTATGQLSDSVASVCHYRVGRIYWETESLRREKDKCFQHFVQSAKFDTENILAFTFLGHYYLLESDRVRAIKCFSKAHSLVVSKNGFSSMIIEFGTISIEHPSKSLCKMYMEEEKLGDACAVLESIVQNCSRDDWAWKTLGVVEMRLSKYDSAIIRLQSALRLNSSDHASWECLGDSYMKEGKFMAALKAFNRSIEVAAGSAISALLYPRCRIADIHYKLGQFEEAVEKYTIILDSSSFSSSGQMLIARKLADSQLYLARELIADGAFGRACDILGRALTLGVGCIHARINTERCAGTLVGVQGMMKVLGDSCAELRMVPGYLHLLDFSTFEKIQLVCQLLLGDKLEVYPTKKNGSLAAAAAPLLSTDYILYIGAAAYQAAISIFASGKLSHPATSKKILANYWHDLACVNYWRYRLYVKESPDGTDQSLLTSAAKYLKTALKQNPKNSLFWNSLGCITFFTGPALAQHSFIRSIEFDSKDSTAWANLGMLYLQNEDFDLAQQAFTSAQYVDPECCLSWFGQVLIAWRKDGLLNRDALFELLEHTMDVGGSSLAQVNNAFSFLHFKRSLDGNAVSDASQFNVPIFSLHKFIDRVFPETSTVNATTNNIPSSDLMSLSSSLNLLGLLLEKQGMFEDAARSLFRANFIISEARKRTSLERTAVIEYKIKENLARVLCSSGQFADSVALYNELEGNLTRGVGEIGFGLALFFSGKLPESFSLLEKGLISCSEPGCFQAAQDEVMVMVAQILYALGTDQHISLSKRQLLDGVSKNNLNLRALFGLCALGLVKGDMALAQNAAAELIGIPPDLLSKAGLEGDVELVLSNLFLIQNNSKVSSGLLAKAIHRRPWVAERWAHLGKLVYQNFPDLSTAAQSALLSSTLMKTGTDSRNLVSDIYSSFGLSILSSSEKYFKNRRSKSMLHRSIRSDPANYGAWFALCIHLRSELVNLAAHPYLLGDGAVQGILDRIKETLSSKCNRIQHILTFLIHNLPRKVEQAEHLMEKSEAQDASSLLVWCRILDADCNVFLAQIQDAADVNSRINYIKAAYSACEEILNSSSGDSGVTSTAFSVMARALRCSGDVTLALECYKKAADQSPSSLIVWEELFDFYTASGAPAAAELCLKQAASSITSSSKTQKVPTLLRLALHSITCSNFSLASEAINESQTESTSTSNLSKLLQSFMCICSGNLGKASKGLQVIASSSSTEEEEMKWLHWTFSRLYFKEGNTALGKEEFLKESHLQKGWIHELV